VTSLAPSKLTYVETNEKMPTSSSGPITMMARRQPLNPPPIPITGGVGYRRPTPPTRKSKSKQPPPQRCSAESRCSVENLVPIGSNYSTWEDPQLTGDPRRLQVRTSPLGHRRAVLAAFYDGQILLCVKSVFA